MPEPQGPPSPFIKALVRTPKRRNESAPIRPERVAGLTSQRPEFGSTTGANNTQRRSGHESGSALLLFPAGLLIVLVLAGIAFDLSLAFQSKRQLVELADSAANDAVTYGLDEVRLRADGSYCLAPSRVARSVQDTLAASGQAVEVLSMELVTATGADCPTGVAITLAGHSPYPFSQAVPGMPAGINHRGTGRATAITR